MSTLKERLKSIGRSIGNKFTRKNRRGSYSEMDEETKENPMSEDEEREVRIHCSNLDKCQTDFPGFSRDVLGKLCPLHEKVAARMFECYNSNKSNEEPSIGLEYIEKYKNGIPYDAWFDDDHDGTKKQVYDESLEKITSWIESEIDVRYRTAESEFPGDLTAFQMTGVQNDMVRELLHSGTVKNKAEAITGVKQMAEYSTRPFGAAGGRKSKRTRRYKKVKKIRRIKRTRRPRR
jgi:hypothetical protein